MIEFSSEVIEYAQDEVIQTLTVVNKGQVQILFKVRTNNIKAIDARPNTGYILKNNNMKITIKRNESISDNVKLQFTYLECKDTLNKDNFKQLWAKYEKNQLSKTFSIRIANSKNEEKKEQRKQIERFQSAHSHTTESDPTLFQSIIVNKFEQNQQTGVSAKKQKYEPIDPKQALKNIQQKRNQNKALEKKLSQTQENIGKAEKSKQLEVQKYLHGPKCKRVHVSTTVIGIIAILFFALGFYLGHHSTHNHSHSHTQA